MVRRLLRLQDREDGFAPINSDAVDAVIRLVFRRNSTRTVAVVAARALAAAGAPPCGSCQVHPWGN